MDKLNYDNKHFVSGTYKDFAVTHEKATLPLHATLHFDADSGTVSGEMEDINSGSIDVAGTFNHSAPYLQDHTGTPDAPTTKVDPRRPRSENPRRSR
ncbi:hypothetical protein DIPPA_21197 [Diplonema papillatum]|nr:hypothetical protein DIPPA_21197 [Diplonema papillatum]